MQLDEITFSQVDKAIKIDQADAKRLAGNPLPIRLSLKKKNGAPVNLHASVSRDAGMTTIGLFDGEKLVGRLLLAKPDIFPAAFYVASMALLPEYQNYALGQQLYYALLDKLGISLVGYDQSAGAQKMWGRLSKMPHMIMYAVMTTSQHGNVYFTTSLDTTGQYQYINYDGTAKPITNGSKFFVVMTKQGGQMDSYIKGHMSLTMMRFTLSRVKHQADPFQAHLAGG